MLATDKNYTKHIHFYGESLPKNLENLVKKKKVGTLLDLGCGDGATLFALKERGLLKEKKVFAADISRERIKKVREIDKKFYCFTTDARQLNKVMKPNVVDLVISSQVIEHVPDQEEFIGQIRRVLRPRGLLYLSTVFKKWYGWYFYKNPQGKWALDPTHLREYQSEEGLLSLFKQGGFRLVGNQKIAWWFPITDFFVKRLGLRNDVYQKNKILRYLRLIKVPILGYYYWELILEKT